MGTFGRIAIGARGQLAYGEEVNWGIPVAPTRRLEFKTESFNNEIGNLLSESLDPSRGISKRVRGTSNITGDIAYEQNTEGYETLYKHALGDRVTMNKVDGGVKTRVTADYAGGAGTISVEDSTVFDQVPGTDWGLAAVYKSPTTGLLTSAVAITYTAPASAITIPVAGTVPVLAKGSWLFQRYRGASDFWDDVYTHFIEAAKDLPIGMTYEVGRDVAFFVYSGVKINTIENTFTSQEILQGTFGTIGKAEYSGADLHTTIAAGATSLILTNFFTTHSLTINGAVFSGTGTNDATSGGTYTGTEEQTFIVEIATTGTPDNFKWSNDGGVTWSANTPIVATHTLADGVQVTFGSTTGHTVGDRWYIKTGDIIGFKPNGGTIQIESENDITYTGVNAYSGVVSGIPASGAGAITVGHTAGVPVVPQSTWGTLTEPPDSNPLSSFQAGVYIDGVFQEVMSATFTLNNNLYTDKYQLGDRFRAGLPEQQRTVEGSINVEFDDMVLYRKYVNGTPAIFEIRCVDDARRLDSTKTTTAPEAHWVYAQKNVYFAHIEYTGTTPQIGGPDQILHDMPFTALRDVSTNTNELVIVFVNARATI